MDDREKLLVRIEKLEALVAEQAATIAEQRSRIEELEQELRRRGKNFRPKGNVPTRGPKRRDQRGKGERKHPGQTRPPTPPTEDAIEHDVPLDCCPFCGGQVDPTGEHEDVYVEDIPEPKVEIHRFRRHVYQCRGCQKRLKGRGDLDVPGGTVGDRIKLLTVFSRAFLGISLGKTTTLLSELYGLSLSRAGALGHLRWFHTRFHPVVRQLLELLKTSSVVHADETGWRINGKNVWCWLFANPRIAVFLIDRSRSRSVFESALGTSLPGVLVSDFYAAYNKIDCKKQRCLTHLLRELAKLREELPARLVAKNIRPLIELFQDAVALGKRRSELSPKAFGGQAKAIRERFEQRWWRTSSDPDCDRIYARLEKHQKELLVFLDTPGVPADNNAGERDIRSVAAARSDGGVNRSDWGAQAFAVAKSIVRTCQKANINFFRYSQAAIDSIRARQPAPLPIADTS